MNILKAWRESTALLAKAVCREEKLAQLAAVGDVDALLNLAITAAKLGLREEDLEPMARSWFTTQETTPVRRNTWLP